MIFTEVKPSVNLKQHATEIINFEKKGHATTAKKREKIIQETKILSNM